MKLWLDAHLSPRLARWINSSFPEVQASALRDVGLRDAEDTAIYQQAGAADAVVMTKDRDFVDLQSRLGSPPRIIWLTCGNTSEVALQQLLTRHLRTALAFLEEGEDLVEISGP